MLLVIREFGELLYFMPDYIMRHYDNGEVYREREDEGRVSMLHTLLPLPFLSSPNTVYRNTIFKLNSLHAVLQCLLGQISESLVSRYVSKRQVSTQKIPALTIAAQQCGSFSTAADSSATEEVEEDGDLPSKKRRRPPALRHSPTTRTPLVTLSGHNQPVTAVVWPKNQENGVITAGWDHCIRLWDLTSGVNTATLVRWRLHCFKTNNTLFCLCFNQISMFTVTISLDLRVKNSHCLSTPLSCKEQLLCHICSSTQTDIFLARAAQQQDKYL